MLYVDFRNTFDSIHRGMMMIILKAYDIPSILLAAIDRYTNLYKKTRARVLTSNGETNLFEIRAGVLQGDTLAPYIFVIGLDFVMRQTYQNREVELGFQLRKRQSRRMTPITITDINFADDFALITEEKEQAQDILNILEHEEGKVGLHCNANKTEIQAFNHEVHIDVKSRNGTTIQVVKNFKYLGAWMERTEKNINVRKALAWKACHNLRKI